MFYLKEWSEDLDLSEFYLHCAERGFENNLSQKRLIGSFQKEREWACWILYSDDTPIGSVVAHSFDSIMGPNTHRILARTCSFREYAPTTGLVTPKRLVGEHQNFTDQFFVPKCLEWAGNSRVFATSNSNEITRVESQRLVHNYYFPTLKKLGLATKLDTVNYKGTNQTVWEIHRKEFLSHLNQFPRWTDL